MNKLIRNILFRFTIVLSVVCIAIPFASIVEKGWWDEGSKQLLQVVILSAICACGEIIYECVDNEYSKRELIIRIILHYFFINIAVISFGITVKWFSLSNISEIIVVLTMTATIYVINILASYYRDNKVAKKMNRKLNEYQNKKEKEEELN